jgi:dipeptidyl aminopeptidase/acylaminoacyl peptidase
VRRLARLALAAVSLGAAPSLLAAATSLLAAPARPVGPSDVWDLPWISDLDVAPDGGRAVYLLSRADRGRDEYVSRLWWIDLRVAGAVPKPLLESERDPAEPRFSPDGRWLAWLASAGERTLLRAARADGRRPRTVLESDEPLGDIEWAPDGERLVVVREDPAPKAATSAPWVVRRSLARRDGEGFLDDRRSHLWIVERDSGTARQITRGAFDDASPRWSPDGRWIAFVSNRAADPDQTDNTDLYRVRSDGGATELVYAGPGPEDSPAWSHDGTRLAVVSARRANDYYQPARVLVVPAAGGEALDLTGGLDLGVAVDDLHNDGALARPIWSPDDRRLFTALDRRGATFLAELDASTPAAGAREVLAGRRTYGRVRPLGDGWIFLREDAVHPPELYRAGSGGAGEAALTRLHGDWLAARRLSVPERFSTPGPGGGEVESWIYPPLDLAPGARAPLVVYIHGGPQGYDGDYFDDGLENQIFPGRGWGVLRVNYRGSTSYGEAFSRAIWGDWQSREYADLMAALDEAIRRYPWIDPQRLGVGGWSYGGIMTLWTVSHSDRFKVGVPERFSFDYSSSFGEDQWFVWMLAELGSPLENAELYRRLSPGTYLSQVKTPLYLIAGENDYNCPLSQVLQAYQRLKLMGQSTELVVYPGESHSFSTPSHLEDRLERLLRWFGRHLD